MESVCRQIDTLGVGMELEFEPTLLAAREGSAAFRERFRNYLRYAREKGDLRHAILRLLPRHERLLRPGHLDRRR